MADAIMTTHATTKKTKPTQRRGRPVSPAARAYEAEKEPITTAGLAPADYARAIRRIARKVGV